MANLPSTVQGAKRPSMQLTWRREGGASAEDLTGATLTGTIQNPRSNTVQAIAGQLVLVDAPNGVFRWDFASADVAQAGKYFVEFEAAFGTGQTPAKSFATQWEVQASATGAA